MSTMIELVGRAIAEYAHKGGDFGLDGATAFEKRRAEFEGMARAAMNAMRELPPQDMILAGYQALMDWDARTGEDHGIFEVWQAMIDAALSGDA